MRFGVSVRCGISTDPVLWFSSSMPVFSSASLAKYRKNPKFLENPQFYSNFQNPREMSGNRYFK